MKQSSSILNNSKIRSQINPYLPKFLSQKMKKIQELKRENANHLESNENTINGYFLNKLFQSNPKQDHTLENLTFELWRGISVIK